MKTETRVNLEFRSRCSMWNQRVNFFPTHEKKNDFVASVYCFVNSPQQTRKVVVTMSLVATTNRIVVFTIYFAFVAIAFVTITIDTVSIYIVNCSYQYCYLLPY